MGLLSNRSVEVFFVFWLWLTGGWTLPTPPLIKFDLCRHLNWLNEWGEKKYARCWSLVMIEQLIIDNLPSVCAIHPGATPQMAQRKWMLPFRRSVLCCLLTTHEELGSERTDSSVFTVKAVTGAIYLSTMYFIWPLCVFFFKCLHSLYDCCWASPAAPCRLPK